MRKKNLGNGVVIDIPETRWEEFWWGIKSEQSRKMIFASYKKDVTDWLIDRASITKAYFKHIGKTFMWFIRAFTRKPVEYHDYIPNKAVRLSKPTRIPVSQKVLPGPIDHFN